MIIKTKGIKKAILIYDHPKYGPRRVMFGEPDKLIELFLQEGSLILRRLQELNKRSSEDPEEMKDAIEDTREWFSRDHGKDAGEDMEMELSYNVKKKQKKK